MNKILISAFFILFLIATFTYNIHHSKQNTFNFLSINNDITKLIVINKDFNLFLAKDMKNTNFDLINHKMKSYDYSKDRIISNELLATINNKELQKSLEDIIYTSAHKFEFIQYYKSYRAILNNSFEVIRKLSKLEIHSDLDSMYVKVMTLNLNEILNTDEIERILEEIDSIKDDYTNKYDKYFLMHSKLILKYQIKLYELKEELFDLRLDNKLKNFQDNYEINSKRVLEDEKLYIESLIIILILLTVIYLIYEYKLYKSNISLLKFRLTLENSDNIIMITDKNHYITYVNKVFTEVTGYTRKEAIGNKASFLKSITSSTKFSKKLKDTLNAGNKWHGEFINKHKDGKLIYEKATITPSKDKKGNILEYIYIKLDITKEVESNIKLKENEKMLNHQSKMAAMGEMLENISHQWRQPLSLISTTASALLLSKEVNLPLTNEEEVKKLNSINNTIQYLSQTIDDFKDFFNPNKEKISFNLVDTYNKTMTLLSSKFKIIGITVIEELNDTNITNLNNEVMQVMMNLLNNAKDALDESKNDEKFIFIKIYKDNDNAIVEVKDNAGGIPDNIIEKIFNPYFTTKHQTQGTGIGLYMSQEIISKHMGGKLDVKNVSYSHNDKNYKGALFTIKLPL